MLLKETGFIACTGGVKRGREGWGRKKGLRDGRQGEKFTPARQASDFIVAWSNRFSKLSR